MDIYTLGMKLSEIINQDGDDKSDGEVVDEIVELLKACKLYIPRI